MPSYTWSSAAAVALTMGLSAAAQSSTPTCTVTNGSVVPTVRGEGLTELVGDIVIVCSGGTAVAAGSTLPQISITVSLNTAITSRLQDSTNGSEALLIVDEPGSGLFGPGPAATQLACPTPLTDCAIISNGGEPYDGSPGHPNVFQGVVSGNTVTFNVPFSYAGSDGVGLPSENARILRITNLRVNASALNGIVSSVVASISPSGLPPLSNQANLTVAFVTSGLVYKTYQGGQIGPANSVDLSACSAGSYCNVAILHYQENFATAFKIQLQGAAQNIPGAIYNSESGFYSPGLATSSANLLTAGLADAGTRLKADFQGVPAGAQLWVGINSISSAGATETIRESGSFNPVSIFEAPHTIDGFAVYGVPVINGAALAVWEVTSANPAQIDIAQFPVWIYFPTGMTPAGALTVKGSFAPNSDDYAFRGGTGTSAQTASYPVPRFTSPPPVIGSLSPSSIAAGGPAFMLTVNASGFLSGAAVNWNGAALPTNFLSDTQLTASVPASLIEQGGTENITIVDPGGNTSASSAFTVISQASLAQLLNPAPVTLYPGSPTTVLSGSQVTFTWSQGVGADDYWLDVGTMPGQGNICAGATTSTSSTCSGIPATGTEIYIQLWTHYPTTGWQSPIRYDYWAATASLATIASPTPGATLSGSTVTFQWNPGTGADDYWLDVGTSFGQGNICAGPTTATQSSCNNIPTTGIAIYVQLWTHYPTTGWQQPNHYTYTAALQSTRAQLTSPLNNASLPGASTTFTWNAVAGADQYWLDVGTASGQGNICAVSTAGTQLTCNGIPVNYVMSTPTPGTQIFNSTTFCWTGQTTHVQLWTHFPGTGWQTPVQYTLGGPVADFWLDVGTVVGQGNISAGVVSGTMCKTVTGLLGIETNADVQLWTRFPAGTGTWYGPIQYSYLHP